MNPLTGSPPRRLRRLCGVPACATPSKYECPRCSLPFCTAACYARHSSICVAAFSEDARSHLVGRKVSDGQRATFNAILQRVRGAEEYGDGMLAEEDGREERGSDSSDEDRGGEEELPPLLEKLMHSLDEDGRNALFSRLDAGMRERLEEHRLSSDASGAPDSTRPLAAVRHRQASRTLPEGDVTDALEQLALDMEHVDLSYEQMLSRLPAELARDFELRLRDGRAARLVVMWRPWWIAHASAVGEEAEGAGEDDTGYTGVELEDGELPPLPRADDLAVPVITARSVASKQVRHGVVEVVAAYCVAMRVCNGDWRADAWHAARRVWEMSAVVSGDGRYASCAEACSAVVQRASKGGGSAAVGLEAVRDTAAVFGGGGEWVVRALFECQRVLEGAKREGAKVRRGVKKVGFLVAWALGEGGMEDIAREVLRFAGERGEDGEELRVARRVVSEMSKISKN